MKGIILYGPPASGKDTITQALTEVDPRCRLFRRLKAGPGKTSTYRMVTEDYIRELSARGDIVWSNSRYGSTYAVDMPELRRAFTAGIPVLHLGQVDAVTAITSATPEAQWVVIALSCPRDTARARLQARSPSDIAHRLQAWDDTPPCPHPDLAIDTEDLEPADAATLILHAVYDGSPGTL